MQTAPPLASGGNHLRVLLAATNNDAGIGRAFDTNGTSGVDGTKPVTFEFDVRLESTNTGFTSNTNDYVTIHNNTGLVSASGTATWIIRVVGGTDPQWYEIDPLCRRNRSGAGF